MIPGEIVTAPDSARLEANTGLPTTKLAVTNTGDRPIQVGSHFHFFEVNEALRFDRAAARGFRLNIPAGTAVRFEAGDTKRVELVALAGKREVYGLNGKINGRLEKVGRVVPNAPTQKGRNQTRRVKDNPPYLKLARLALATDKFPFSGYPRWQINDRWDVLATREAHASYAREESALGKLAKAAATVPPALGASLQFRHYLAQRDRFVRSAAQSVFRARRHLARGKTPLAAKVLTQAGRDAAQLEQEIKRARLAARAMWRRSRDPWQPGPNEEMLVRDAQRLRALRTWLRCTLKNPSLANGATPVCGRWQLQFTVHNFAPALQKIVVEQQRADGSWVELHNMFTIEFKAAAAQPRAKIVREISVPIDATDARLRIAVRGVGQVAIGRITLTDGIVTRSPAGSRKKVILGQPAPRSGFPSIDWAKNCGEIELDFSSM